MAEVTDSIPVAPTGTAGQASAAPGLYNAHLARVVRTSFGQPGYRADNHDHPYLTDELASCRTAFVRFKRAVAAGMRIAMGTGSAVTPHGENLRELALMAQGGLRPEDVLVATTSAAAELLGLDAELGTIEPDKRADLVLVDGDRSACTGWCRSNRLCRRGPAITHPQLPDTDTLNTVGILTAAGRQQGVGVQSWQSW